MKFDGVILPGAVARLHLHFEPARMDIAATMSGAALADEQVGATAPVRVGPKVGRNDPRPCGSGKKYKRCCGTRT